MKPIAQLLPWLAFPLSRPPISFRELSREGYTFSSGGPEPDLPQTPTRESFADTQHGICKDYVPMYVHATSYVVHHTYASIGTEFQVYAGYFHSSVGTETPKFSVLTKSDEQ